MLLARWLTNHLYDVISHQPSNVENKSSRCGSPNEMEETSPRTTKCGADHQLVENISRQPLTVDNMKSIAIWRVRGFCVGVPWLLSFSELIISSWCVFVSQRRTSWHFRNGFAFVVRPFQVGLAFKSTKVKWIFNGHSLAVSFQSVRCSNVWLHVRRLQTDDSSPRVECPSDRRCRANWEVTQEHRVSASAIRGVSNCLTCRFHFRLAKTNIEDQVVSSYLVNDANCNVTLAEFALRLQISLDDPSTMELFTLFDKVGLMQSPRELQHWPVTSFPRTRTASSISENIWSAHCSWFTRTLRPLNSFTSSRKYTMTVAKVLGG